jgi:hypothetical protein
VLIRAQEGDWLFGGFTAVGFSPPPEGYGYIADPSGFLFSLTSSRGRPEKLESNGTGEDLNYNPFYSATFGNDLHICGNADAEASSYTWTGSAYAESASTGAHPMAQGHSGGWKAAEVVAWVV